jgi:predicted RNA-binding protein YlqC (UPF0109 family)
MAKSEAAEQLRRYAYGIVQGLVDHGADVEVNVAELRHSTLLLQVSVARADLGKLIGVKGRMATSLRTVMATAAAKHKLTCELAVVGDPILGGSDGR